MIGKIRNIGGIAKQFKLTILAKLGQMTATLSDKDTKITFTTPRFLFGSNHGNNPNVEYIALQYVCNGKTIVNFSDMNGNGTLIRYKVYVDNVLKYTSPATTYIQFTEVFDGGVVKIVIMNVSLATGYVGCGGTVTVA